MFKQGSHIVLLFIISMTLFGCHPKENTADETTFIVMDSPIHKRNDTVIRLNHAENLIEIAVLRTELKRKGTILALPGWNYPYSHWCDSTNLCQLAKRNGYDLVMPTMGKTIYSDSIYPQTKQDWKGEVTRKWINEVMIPMLQKDLDVLLDQESNKIIGISTGGRGALLLAIDHPGLFDAGASLSGDFEMSNFPNDNLYIGFFGPFSKHKDIWMGIENPLNQMNELETPFYFAHGSKDNIVPLKHLLFLKEEIDTVENVINVVTDGKHDYTLWRMETEKAFLFFEK